MKKFITVVAVLVGVSGCAADQTKVTPVAPRGQQAYNIEVKRYACTTTYFVVDIDGCEYLFDPGNGNGSSIAHKGNCKAAVHTRR